MPKLVVGRQGLVRHYRGIVFRLHEGHRERSFPAYTYARSRNQARRFLNQRHPYPPYIITDIEEAG